MVVTDDSAADWKSDMSSKPVRVLLESNLICKLKFESVNNKKEQDVLLWMLSQLPLPDTGAP